jgi:serine/threonine protein kinase
MATLNILLNSDMEPIISDFGLERLVFGNTSSKASNSARFLGSQQRPTAAIHEGLQDLPTSGSSPYAPGVSSVGTAWPYQAPESLKNVKPNPKGDVYSFGVVLLELLAGRVFSEPELVQWTAGSVAEEKNRVLKMVDAPIRSEVVGGREDAMLACFKLGFSCASFVPHKRPSMKDALQILERIPWSSFE